MTVLKFIDKSLTYVFKNCVKVYYGVKTLNAYCNLVDKHKFNTTKNTLCRYVAKQTISSFNEISKIVEETCNG